ncbi:E3 ubiquitin-protein ligase RNF135 isoform X1 [Lepus europaeus]|uniref:E3 ubiquitin-protein ligase RNF135 isoform X1 n=1 Tax=Lepus europaeus TaxID=9983 RepID=UPI002B4703D1|nr:E3 ubiquitin-protein ligase RNF135 isoform X1 [Lepus europaeus]
MADPGPSPAVPVWLSEDDLGCIICHGLLSWPVTLPCGHSFCRHCLTHLWDSRDARRRWACPTCREGAAQPPRLRKNTLLQDLADKYSRAAREPDADPAPAARAAPPRVAIPKNLTEVGEELTGLVEQLVDIVRSLQSQRCPLEPGPDGGLSAEGAAFSSGVDLSLAAPKHVTSSASEGKMGDVLRGLEEIQEKLRESFTWKEAPEEHTRVEVPEAPSTSACPLPNQNCPAPKRASRFAQWAISPTFDLRSVSHSLWVSEDQRTVTVSHHPQSYPWSRERFSISQVFCSQALSSGRQYWEVDTKSCSHWAVGVASWGMSRDRILGRTTDSWCVEWKGTGQLAAWSMDKQTLLDSDRPGVVGVWLDLEEGTLAFYSVASEETLLYECEVSASSPLHPAFWLYGLRPGNSLTIEQGKL